MNKTHWIMGLLALGMCTGCSSDIVATRQLKLLDHKCVHIATIESENPYVGQVIKEILAKEFLRHKVQLGDADTANIFITGTTFMTVRAVSKKSQEAIESVSLEARDRDGKILLSASYDNTKRYTASRLAKEFGQALASKLR
jgi:hypothetical protein